MCQLTPFTLPCCPHIYVQVEKLPSCPDDWPRKKCPKELCIQISGYETKDIPQRPSGICWRCLSHRMGKMGWERDGMRPVLDKAFVVNGLEEFTIDERRRRVERAGMCWFCGAHGGCENCGTGEGVHGRGSRKEVLTGFKRDRYQADIGRAKGENKRAKLEHARNSNMAPSSMASGPDFQQELVDPSLLPFQKYNLNSRAFRYNHFRQSAPNFDYQPQEAKFQAPAASMIPPTSTGRQGVQDLQSQVINAGYSSENAPVDPSLEGPPGIEQQHQSFDLPLHQKQEFPPLPEFGGDSADLEFHDTDDESFARLLAGYRYPDICKNEKEDTKPATQTSAAAPGEQQNVLTKIRMNECNNNMARL